MANIDGFYTSDSQASSKPQYFGGNNYGQKQRMQAYAEATDLVIWRKVQ